MAQALSEEGFGAIIRAIPSTDLHISFAPLARYTIDF